MAACIWETLKYNLGFWGAIAVLGVIVAAIVAIGVTPAGPGVVALVTAIVDASLAGAAGVIAAGVGGTGLIATLVVGIITCF